MQKPFDPLARLRTADHSNQYIKLKVFIFRYSSVNFMHTPQSSINPHRENQSFQCLRVVSKGENIEHKLMSATM